MSLETEKSEFGALKNTPFVFLEARVKFLKIKPVEVIQSNEKCKL